LPAGSANAGTCPSRSSTASSSGHEAGAGGDRPRRPGIAMRLRRWLQPGIAPGDLVVSHGSLRNDGTSDAYVPRGYPAVPDLELTVELDRVARFLGNERGFAVHSGINATDDAFYAETPEWIAELSRLGVKNVEMESSALFVVARQRGWRAGMVCACSSNLVAGSSLYDLKPGLLLDGWRQSIEVALEVAVSLDL